ncbi:universal stress protein [Halohasta litorea]|uniref:Universal stress protein n=1 Tax=Halohasta litorea TaxID=869891 RepID=A0ABD6D6P7_9EURY|nr:universal stress protein [Halohasta litorea]
MDHSIDSILVPTDGSEGAEPGIRHGIGLAADVGADLHTLSVVDSVEINPSLSRIEAESDPKGLFEARATRATDAVAELAESHLDGAVTTAVEWGRPFKSITEYARANEIDLIVMGTHGRSGLKRFVLGSVAEKVLRTTSVPVLLVPPQASVDGVEVEYSEILLPTDGSEAAETAVDWGLTLADIYDGTVHSIYSVDTARFAGEGGMMVLFDALEETGQAALDSIRKRAHDAGIGVTAELGTGPPARVIGSYSEDHEVDLIVMGTHGRSGLDRYLIGSVTESVVRHAAVPVCCVPMEQV